MVIISVPVRMPPVRGVDGDVIVNWLMAISLRVMGGE
jgi:hypothetical protein